MLAFKPGKRLYSLILCVFCLPGYALAAKNNPVSDADQRTAEKLFSGPTEEDLYSADEMLVSATGSLKPVFLAPSVATVVTSKEIEAMGATTLDEILETVPGLHVAPSLLIGPLMNTYTIRGISTNLNPEVLVLINGIPVKEEFNGYRNLRSTLPVSMISRVEIVRGPGSAIFGADAFAGTINVITKDGHEINGVQVGMRQKSFDTNDFWLQYGGQHKGWDVVAGFEVVHEGSDSKAIIDSDLQTGLDIGFTTSASLAPRAQNLDRDVMQFNFGLAKDHWNLRFWGQKIDNAGLGIGVAPILDSQGVATSDRYTWDAIYQGHELGSDLILDLRLNYSYYDAKNSYVIFPAGAVLLIGDDGNAFTPGGGVTFFTDGYLGNPGINTKTTLVEAVTKYQGVTQHSMRFAMGYRRIEASFSETKNFGPGILDGSQGVVDGTLTDVTGTQFIYAPDTTRKLWYLSAQDEWAFAKHWELTAGIRYDDYSDFGSTVNPRLALVWQTRYDLITKLLYGRAFRAPTIGELSAQNNPIGLGNPNIDPEIIDTLELAIDYRPSVDIRLNANVFFYDINGLIEFVAGAGGSVAQNARDQRGRGLELEADWDVNNKLKLAGNMAWQQSEDKATGIEVPNTPQFQAYANANWKFLPKWSVDAQWFWIGDRKRATGDTRPAIDDYSLVNLTLRRKNIIKDIDIAFGLRNALDEDAREPSDPAIANDIPLNSRALWAEVRGQF